MYAVDLLALGCCQVCVIIIGLRVKELKLFDVMYIMYMVPQLLHLIRSNNGYQLGLSSSAWGKKHYRCLLNRKLLPSMYQYQKQQDH